jgi:hypothetical protein
MKHKISLLLILFTSTFFSCRREGSLCIPNHTYQNMMESDKLLVKYTGEDTLIFVNNFNDTAICIGQGKKQYYLIEPINNYNKDTCTVRSTHNYEAFRYTFNSPTSEFYFDLLLRAGAITINYKNRISFEISLGHINERRAVTYLDSITILNKTYKNVTFSNQFYNPKFARLYYNQEFGVLKIQNSDSTEVWELLTKK